MSATTAGLTVHDCVTFLESFAPLALAEEWDNVGLLVGDRNEPLHRVLTCLTLTPDVADEAIREQAQLVVTHHPVLFRKVRRITADAAEGAMLLRLIRAGVAVYSPHTAFDSAAEGINTRLAKSLGLDQIEPLRPAPPESAPAGAGTGRHGRLPEPVTLAEFIEKVHAALPDSRCLYTGDLQQRIERVGIGCGSAAEFLDDAIRARCDAFLTGEARFHASLQARAAGIALVLAGHYATERPAVEDLATTLRTQFPGLDARPSAVERDPVQWSER